jgi:hypothetical protein
MWQDNTHGWICVADVVLTEHDWMTWHVTCLFFFLYRRVETREEHKRRMGGVW